MHGIVRKQILLKKGGGIWRLVFLAWRVCRKRTVCPCAWIRPPRGTTAVKQKLLAGDSGTNSTQHQAKQDARVAKHAKTATKAELRQAVRTESSALTSHAVHQVVNHSRLVRRHPCILENLSRGQIVGMRDTKRARDRAGSGQKKRGGWSCRQKLYEAGAAHASHRGRLGMCCTQSCSLAVEGVWTGIQPLDKKL